MSGGRVSTAAMLAAPATARPNSRRHRHCPAEEWQAYVEKDGGNRQYRLMKLRFRRQFVERVGDDHRRPAVAGRCHFEQSIEDHQRITQRAGHDDRVQASERAAAQAACWRAEAQTRRS